MAAHATLDTQQLISCTRTASLQNLDGGVIPDQEVHELLNKIYDIMNNVLSKWAGNTAHFSIYF